MGWIVAKDKPGPLSRINRYRAARAREALRMFMVDVCIGDEKQARIELREDFDSALIDLLTDLLHLCDVRGADFADLERRARNHYRDEMLDESEGLVPRGWRDRR